MGNDIGMSDRTFHNGLKELIAKGFLSAKAPNQFWVNPALFFKGDRVAFLKEYRIRGSADSLSGQATKRMHDTRRKDQT